MQKKISFYLDEHMPRAVKRELETLGIETIMANDVGMTGKDDDSEHLPYATLRGMVLVTQDRAFAGRAQLLEHHGVICWTGKENDLGGMLRVFSEFAEVHTPDDVRGRVFWLK